MNPSGYINLIYWGRLWRDTDLTKLSCITYPAGRSAYNPIEHAWSPLSNALTGVILPATLDGEEKPPNKQNISIEQRRIKEAEMLDNASQLLVKYWEGMTYDTYPVIPISIPSKEGECRYSDHDTVTRFVNARLADFNANDQSLILLRKEFNFFAVHADRRSNEIAFMKCQLFKKSDICQHCLDNPPIDCNALHSEINFGGFFFDAVSSESHPDHFKTYIEMINDKETYVPKDTELGRCNICPNWWFSSEAEKQRHRKLLHPNTKQLFLSRSNTIQTKKHVCHFKIGVENKECGQVFTSYHRLYAHKKKELHTLKSISKQKTQENKSKDEKRRKESETIKRFFKIPVKSTDVEDDEEKAESDDYGEEEQCGEDDCSNESQTDEEKEEEECASNPCTIENCNDDELEWIECERCLKWFHKFCCGLNGKKSVTKHFYCGKCS